MNTTILVVDDDDDFRESVKMLLEEDGYIVLEASNGNEAIRVIQTVNIDLMLTDVLMPEMDGIELSKKINEIQPLLKVMGMSGGGMRETASEIKTKAASYFQAFLHKPFTLEELVGSIEELVV